MSGYITWIFCAFIVLVFLYFIIEARKIKTGFSIINKSLSNDQLLASLDGTKLAQLKSAFEKSINIETTGGIKTNIPASEVFSEWNINKALNVNARMLDAASGTLVGLGLLGTFLGLTLGINGFDSSNSENIQTSIQTLLDGMGTAFVTSLLGMSLSIIYTIFEKQWRNNLIKAASLMDEKLDDMYYIDDMSLMVMKQETFISSMTENLSTTVNANYDSLKEFLNSQTDKAKTELRDQTTKIETALRGLLMYTTEDGKSVIIANAIREILKENEQQTKALKSFSTDLALQLNEGFENVLSSQLQQRILPLMESVDATTKSLIEHIDQMAQNLTSPATDMIQVVASELKTSMQEILAEFKSSLSTSATNELEQLALSLGSVTQAMGDFPKNMEYISTTLQTTIEEVKNAITEISNTSASTNSTAMTQMQEQISFATTSIGNAIMEVKEVMSALTNSSQANVDGMMSKMAGASDRMSQFMTEMMEKVSSSVKDSMQSITNEMVEKQMSLMALQEDMTREMRANVQNMTSSSEQTATGVIKSLELAQTSMGDFMQKTMERIATSVQGSMDTISSDITDKQATILEFQESTLKETKRLVETFNLALDRLERMSEYVSGTMDMFQKAQGEITGSTANLRTISEGMKTATETFSRSQNEYARSMTDLQRMSQSNIDSVTDLMKNSSEMSDDYVAKFETIKKGLSGIFDQIQVGLNEYSRTVQTSLQSFLGDYASSLTKTTDALSNTIQQQSDVVEMLVESMSKRR